MLTLTQVTSLTGCVRRGKGGGISGGYCGIFFRLQIPFVDVSYASGVYWDGTCDAGVAVDVYEAKGRDYQGRLLDWRNVVHHCSNGMGSPLR